MKHILTAGLLYLSVLSFGQVGIGTAQPNNNAILDLTATNKGFLPPRMTTLQRDAIPGVSQGLMIFNTDLKCLQYWDTSNWVGNCKTTAPGIITALDCSTAVFTGTLEENLPASGVSATIAYSGGNGGTHSGQTVTSTGVTGLTATLAPGAFANGNGMLTYIITGTPMGSGTASFAINLGGQACNLMINVDSPPPPIPDLSATCAPGSWTLPFKTNNTSASSTVKGIPVTASFSNYSSVSKGTAGSPNACGVDKPNEAEYYLMGRPALSATLKIKFSSEISNMKVTHVAMHPSETYSYTLKRKGKVVVADIEMSTSTTCNSDFTITSNTIKYSGDSNGGSITYNIGGIWFDEMEIKASDSKIPSESGNGSLFKFCISDAKN